MPTVTLARAAPSSSKGILDYPYSNPVNDVVRRIPGREFNDAYKRWLIPLTPSNVLLLKQGVEALPGWTLFLPADLRHDLNREYARQKNARAVRDVGDADIAFDFKTQPYAHQRAGLAFLAHLGGGALLWEMGLGKTKTAIDYAEWLARGEVRNETPERDISEIRRYSMTLRDEANHPLKVLVICPNTVKRNWGDEIEKHAGHQDWTIPKGTIPQRASQLATHRYTVVNCEVLSDSRMVAAMRQVNWDLIVVDESTRFKNPQAARTKALMKLMTRHRVILTGTPITGKPQDAYAQFEWVAPGTFGASFWAFKQHYLDINQWTHEIVGIKPGLEPELRSRIDEHAYRIRKADVLDLPEKVYIDRFVTMPPTQRAYYNQMRDELRVEIEGRDDLTANNILTLLLRLTQITAGMVGERGGYEWLPNGAKVTELDDLLDDLGTQQVVIFGQYQFELEALAARYAPPSTGLDKWDQPPILYGPTPEARRHELVTQFQAGDRRLLFAQTRTGGIGINLTAAQTAIYYTRSWSLEEYLQSQDRLHRIGQTGTVSVIHLLAEDSIDADISDTLKEKQALADYLTGDSARSLAGRVLGM